MDIDKAFLTLIVMQAVEDGKLTDDESDAILSYYRGLGWSVSQTGAEIDEQIAAMDKMTYRELNKELSRAAWTINNKCDIVTKATMIDLLIYLAEIDQNVDSSEKEFVGMLAGSWGVDMKPGSDAEGKGTINEDRIK